MKNIIFFTALFIISIVYTICITGCSLPERDAALVGTVSYYYDIVCLKTDTSFNPGLSSSGNLHVTTVTTCIRSECFKFKKTLGKTFFDDKSERLELVSVDKCVK